MLDLQALIRDNMDELARSITREQGKTFADAKGDVLRGLQVYKRVFLCVWGRFTNGRVISLNNFIHFQVVEHACSIPTLLMGEKLPVSRDMDTYTYRQPLGVVGGVMPFNFPAMIPLWVFPLAIATGNTCIIKPSERDPGGGLRSVEE